MAEGRNQFVYGWRAVGLVFIFFASYCSTVEGISSHAVVESLATDFVQVKEGERSLVPCKINRNVDLVIWDIYWGSYYELVILDLSVNPPIRSGQGYDSGLFNITDDFSLVINEVQPEDENLYYCSMWENERGVLYQNSTVVLVRRKGHPMITADISSTADTSSTATTPKSDCSPDNVFKMVFGVSVAALVFSWVLIPLCLHQWESRRADKVFTPLSLRGKGEEEEGGGEADEL